MLINLWPGFGGALGAQTELGATTGARFYGKNVVSLHARSSACLSQPARFTACLPACLSRQRHVGLAAAMLSLRCLQV